MQDIHSAQVGIFISHKHEDEKTARAIKRILKDLDSAKKPRFKFFLSEEISGGENWYQWIREKLLESNLLLLVFTDATKSWDWCLYEAGLFDRLDGDHYRKIICLHSRTTEPPKPLQHLQAFPAIPKKLKLFLKQLFIQTELTGLDEPIADWLLKVPEKIESTAQELANLIDRIPVASDYYKKYLFINVSNPDDCIKPIIPKHSKITSAKDSLAIFGKGPGKWEWGDIEENARLNKDVRWIDQLGNAICSAAGGDIPDPIYALFRSIKGKDYYRPMLYKSDKLADGSMVFKVLFDEEVDWKIEDVPNWLSSLLTSLVLGTRFKYELINSYKGKIGQLDDDKIIEDTCLQIENIISNIEEYASSRGLLEKENLIKGFNVEHQKEIEEIYEHWYDVRVKFIKALSQKDKDKIENLLLELALMNKRFLQLAASRYLEIIEEET
jgi:hypothetical protein